MEAPYLDAIRQSYDAVAADYARSVKDPAELDPLSRAVLAAFAEFHRTAGARRAPAARHPGRRHRTPASVAGFLARKPEQPKELGRRALAHRPPALGDIGQ